MYKAGIIFSIYMSAILLMGCIKRKQTEIKDMTGEELEKNIFDSHEKAPLIVDVRTRIEYKIAGHIPNTINVQLEYFLENPTVLDNYKNSPIIFYCNTRNRSGEMAEYAIKNGFTDITNAFGVQEYDYDLVSYDDISAYDFLKKLEEEDVFVIDIRTAEEFKKGHIFGAINIEKDEIKNNLDKLPKDKPIILYGTKGKNSGESVKELSDLGYDNIHNVVEGLEEFEYTLVK